MFSAKKYLQRPGWQKSRPGLERISKLMEMLGNPQNQLKFIHLAGTNGKGSTCAYINQILIDSGYKTGLFTSPYIYDFCERIKVNNQNISEVDLNSVTQKVKEQADKFPTDNHPTEFELITAAGLMYFHKCMCDVVVLEVGMGGRLDATNIINSANVFMSVITPIAKDHETYLGNTVKDIAQEKAGIIKQNTDVITSNTDYDIIDVLQKQCLNLNSKLNIVNFDLLNIGNVDLCSCSYRSFAYKNFECLKTQLLGIYQPKNAALAIEACLLLSHNLKKINKDNIIKGIENTYWPARFELIGKEPYVVIDGGHNSQGVDVLIDSLKNVFPNKKFVFIMGVLADKDYISMCKKIAPYSKKVFVIAPPNPRRLNEKDLSDQLNKLNIQTEIVHCGSAIRTAVENSHTNDVICAFGSLYSISCLTGRA